MKRFTLIILFIFLIIRVDIWECKFGTAMDFKSIPKFHPLQQLVITLHGELSQLKKKIPNINFGGCGVFAYEMKKALDSLGVQTSILIIDEEQDYLNKKEYLNNVVNMGRKVRYTPTSVNHVILMIDELKLAVDASGVHSLTFHPVITDRVYMWHGMHIMGEYTMKELEYAAYHSQWNSVFNRRRIPELKYYISLIKDKIEGRLTTDTKELKRLINIRKFWQVIESPVRLTKLYFT